MGLFSTTHEHHSHHKNTYIRYPDTIKVHEHKSPTDESIRLMEDAHNKAIKNIIAKVKVEDNLVNGECFCVEQPWNLNDIKLYFKFKINGKEFMLERELSRYEMGLDDRREINRVVPYLESHAKSVMLWYVLKMFTASAYEQITKQKFPEQLLK